MKSCEHDHRQDPTRADAANSKNTAPLFEDGERKFITLELEDGTEKEFMVIEIFEAINHKQYIVLMPEEEVGSEEAETYLYRFRTDVNGDPILEVIEDRDELDIACDAFDEILDEIEYNEMLTEEDK
ncbi:MAG: DUF1292 domain-containing protein [Lachnospiraceae bacterium]|nr:DUF1292 domain-containing protein [Lachnospiraceae bacterium]